MKRFVGKILYKFFSFFPASDSKFNFGGKFFRYLACKLYLNYCGKFVNIDRNSFIGQNVCIDDFSGIGKNSYISNNVKIGKYVMMGPECLIYTTNHKFSSLDTPMCFQKWEESKNVVIGDDVWIGGRVIILPGVKIGNGVVIGAGSVVTKDVPDFAVVGGNPARILKYRKEV